MEILHHWLEIIVKGSIFILELIGIFVLMQGALRALYNYIKHDPHTRLKLCRAMAMALEFKLGGEILRTVIVRDLSEIALIGGIIVLRAGLTFLIHWAITTEEAEEKEHEEHIYHEPTIAPRRPKNVCDMPHNHNKLDTETHLIDHA